MKQTKKEADTPMPPGTEAIFNITCKDVVMGRGSGTQNHCGNVTYRKLVYLNKELYATSSKFDKLKISKAIVAAIRRFGGRFLQAKGGNGHFDIGDKRAWDKTSQALREGQTEIRARLAAEEENASGAQKVAEYKQVITEQTFLAYAYKILQSLYDPSSSTANSCGPNCPHAKRRATLNRTDAMALQHAMAMQMQQQMQQQQPGNIFVDQQQFQSHQPYVPQNPYQYEAPMQNYAHHNMASGNVGYNNNYSHIPQNAYPGQSPVNAYTESMPALPQAGVPLPPEDLDTLEPLPYNVPYLQQPQCIEIAQPDMNFEGEQPLRGRNRDTIGSCDTNMNSVDTECLRKLLSDDVDMESDEMSKQLSDMMRRKSQGLVRIDAIEAFEDLVFEEDSAGRVKFDFPEPQVSNATDRRFSGLTDRGESLMNMSLLTIEDRDGKETAASESSVKRPSKVSFAPENISTLSLDVSLSDIGYDHNHNTDSPPRGPKSNGKGSSTQADSRSMGFPIRKTVMRQLHAGVPTVIPTKVDDKQKKVSTLTFSEASALQHDVEFNELARNVDPPSDQSFKLENMSMMSMMSIVDDESILDEDKKDVSRV